MMNMVMYKMKANKYMGNCFCVVARLDQDYKGFTGREITTLIKTDMLIYDSINSLPDLIQTDLFPEKNPLFRVGSSCFLGSLGDSHCNCEDEKIEALRTIGKRGGIYMELPQEAQGLGLFYKANELHLQVNGYLQNGDYVGCQSQSEAAKILTGNEIIDARRYDVCKIVLDRLSMSRQNFILMTANPNKIRDFMDAGIQISGMYEVNSLMNTENMAEFLTKWIDKGFLFSETDVLKTINLLQSQSILPVRATRVLSKAANMLANTNERAILEENLLASQDCKQELFNLICNRFTSTKAMIN